MATFTFSVVDEAAGFKAERKFSVDDKQASRIFACFEACYDLKEDRDAAFGHMAGRMIDTIVGHVAGWERAQAALDPIEPKPE